MAGRPRDPSKRKIAQSARDLPGMVATSGEVDRRPRRFSPWPRLVIQPAGNYAALPRLRRRRQDRKGSRGLPGPAPAAACGGRNAGWVAALAWGRTFLRHPRFARFPPPAPPARSARETRTPAARPTAPAIGDRAHSSAAPPGGHGGSARRIRRTRRAQALASPVRSTEPTRGASFRRGPPRRGPRMAHHPPRRRFGAPATPRRPGPRSARRGAEFPLP
jgi:hypothetical protein